MASISLRQLVKCYGWGRQAQEVLHGINAEVADGEFIVIVGPSGCGKSTLLRMIAGLERVTSGEIVFTSQGRSQVVNEVEPSERNIAMVFQNYALYPHMSVFDNIAYGLKIAGLPRAEIQARVAKVAESLELSALLERKPRQLSGGQRQRVAMGRAIVRQPQVFLFDEPLSNLDAKLRGQTRLEIQRLHAALGITSLFVTHDQVEAMTLAQRMIVMNGGHIEQIGTPEEVYGRPATAFVAGFIGSPAMNLLAGERRGDRFHMAGDTSVGVPWPEGEPAPTTRLLLGVRPEHLRRVPTNEAGAWPLTVEVTEMLGAERLIHARVGDGAGGPLLTVRVDATLVPPRPGERIAVRPGPDAIHVFDAETGRRHGAGPDAQAIAVR